MWFEAGNTHGTIERNTCTTSAVAQQVSHGEAPPEMSSQSNMRELLRKGPPWRKVIQLELKFNVGELSNKVCEISMFNMSSQEEIRHMKGKEQLQNYQINIFLLFHWSSKYRCSFLKVKNYYNPPPQSVSPNFSSFTCICTDKRLSNAIYWYFFFLSLGIIY